jgi:hypothetical protein
MKIQNLILAGIFMLGSADLARAAVTQSEAQQLGTTLTQFGAKQGASADGAIPAYTGGIAAMSNLPVGSATTGYPDPFANEKRLFSVTSANMAQYASQLTPGALALLTRYPDFRIDVYPTHRTASYPSWVIQNTLKNAASAQEIGDGDGVTGAYGGIPFPIPQDGAQVIWNNFMSYRAADCRETYGNYLVDADGGVTDLGIIQERWVEPYYDPKATTLETEFWKYRTTQFHTPAAQAGTMYLFEEPPNFQQGDDVTYFYSPGVRRIRLAPEFKYDTPIATYGGAFNYDELDLLYGRLNKFDFRLVGQKEMIVPYNDYAMDDVPKEELLKDHFLNPDVVRWERHRVWIVDATLRPGERHVDSRRTFYIDEDSWNILATESYDHGNNLYRVGFLYPYQDYSDGAAVTFAHTYGFYDLSKGDYQIAHVHTNHSGFYTCSTTLPPMTQMTPQALAAQAIR